VQGYKNKLD